MRPLSSALFCLLLTACAATPDLATRLASGDRSAEDKARDAGRQPAQVLAFLGARPGMTALDVIAAGGWYSEVLAEAVGPTGRVYAQNPAVVLKFRDGANDKALTARLANDRLPNVVRWDREFADLGLVAVVEPARSESFQQAVAAFEVDADATADRGVAEGGGQEGLADADGSHDDGVVAGVDEAQGAQLVPDGAVVGDLGGVVPAVEGHGRV